MIIYDQSGQLVLLSPADPSRSPADIAQAEIPADCPWTVVEGELPAAPRSAWNVNWMTGVITVDPAWTQSPLPNYPLAWAALITAPLYSRIYALAQTHPPIALEMALLTAAYHSHDLLPPDPWALALSTICQRLAALVNATEAPLTQEEQQWVEAWSTTHHLGLSLTWEA